MAYNHAEYMKGWRAKRKALGLSTGGKASPEWWNDYREQYYADPKNKAKRAANMKRYRKDPALRFKMEARWILHRAIKAGRIKRGPCSICGNPKSEAHHNDYHQPFLVTWLCARCHRLEHAKAEGRG